MSEVTRILNAIGQNEPHAAEQLLPLVYDELRRLAAEKMAQEKPGQTLQATALVHEAYLRLVDAAKVQHWDTRRHFFAAAAEAMRRILVEQARRKKSRKHGGGLARQEAIPEAIPIGDNRDPLEILSVQEALDRLAQKSPRKAELVKLRYFMGCTIPEAAEILGIAPATAEEDWTYARAWLRRHLGPAGRADEKMPLP
jgi:RNA polymerase sigma factor (TIGR02999 family)